MFVALRDSQRHARLPYVGPRSRHSRLVYYNAEEHEVDPL